MDKKKSKSPTISAAIRSACKDNFGVLDTSFLCQSVSIINMHSPVAVKDTDSLATAIGLLKSKSIGCVVVLDKNENLSGIFTERDCFLKVLGNRLDFENTPVSQYMSKEPATGKPDDTIAYALNLMSQGGFRHLPITDASGMPVGIISIRDVIDYIVDSFTKDLLAFETLETNV
jgi:CBS domain-containing protein